jgi:hypothetical protein
MIEELKQIVSDKTSTPEQMKKAQELLTALTPKPVKSKTRRTAIPEEMTDAQLQAEWDEWANVWGIDPYGDDVSPVDVACELMRRERKQKQ